MSVLATHQTRFPSSPSPPLLHRSSLRSLCRQGHLESPAQSPHEAGFACADVLVLLTTPCLALPYLASLPCLTCSAAPHRNRAKGRHRRALAGAARRAWRHESLRGRWIRALSRGRGGKAPFPNPRLLGFTSSPPWLAWTRLPYQRDESSSSLLRSARLNPISHSGQTCSSTSCRSRSRTTAPASPPPRRATRSRCTSVTTARPHGAVSTPPRRCLHWTWVGRACPPRLLPLSASTTCRPTRIGVDSARPYGSQGRLWRSRRLKGSSVRRCPAPPPNCYCSPRGSMPPSSSRTSL